MLDENCSQNSYSIQILIVFTFECKYLCHIFLTIYFENTSRVTATLPTYAKLQKVDSGCVFKKKFKTHGSITDIIFQESNLKTEPKSTSMS